MMMQIFEVAMPKLTAETGGCGVAQPGAPLPTGILIGPGPEFMGALLSVPPDGIVRSVDEYP